MSLLHRFLLALLALGTPPLCPANVTTSVWHRALVAPERLAAAAATSRSYQVLEEILCAILANTNSPWCHLFTYEGTTCVLYPVVVDSVTHAPPGNTTTTPTTTPCRTRHRNVCIIGEEEPLAHGDTHDHDCLPSTCWNGALVPSMSSYTMSATCAAPFTLADVGCVHLQQQPKTWCEARLYCARLQADLAVVSAEAFPALQTFLVDNASENQVWVGVKARQWLDGRDVTSAEWRVTDPNGALDSCALMGFDKENQEYRLRDRGCSLTYVLLCMRL